MADLLSKDHTILERPFMEFRPFGVDEQGEKIRDSSGVVVRNNVEYLEECVRRQADDDAAARVAQQLCNSLNERMRDSAYHVTPEFLKHDWYSYSYEFVCYLREFCKVLAGDPLFQYNLGKDRYVTPLIQILGRPFTLPQIYRMYPYFAQKYAKGVCEFGVGEVTDHSAVVRLRYTERALRQVGPYLKACALNACDVSKSSLSIVPEKVYGLPSPAAIQDRLCIVQGDEWCEWEFTWSPCSHGGPFRAVWDKLRHIAGFQGNVPTGMRQWGGQSHQMG
jgi:hypothetical protein